VKCKNHYSGRKGAIVIIRIVKHQELKVFAFLRIDIISSG